LAIEFRNASLLREDVFSLLREHEMALCFNDLESMPFSPETTTDFAYFGWLALPSRNHNTSLRPRDLTEGFIVWVARVRAVASQVDEVYGLFNDRYGGHAAGAAKLVKDILGLSAVDPRSMWPPQLSMFEE